MNTRVRTNTRLKQSQFNGVSRCGSRLSTRTLLDRNRTLKRNSFNNTQRFLATKKNLGTEMAPSYNPKEVEKGWFEWWMERGFFKPASNAKPNSKVFSMILPPPNVTGKLHVGHALTVALEDAMARWKRMNGEEVIWIPGLDHAGIATQAVVEKHLLKQNITRTSLGRDSFVSHVWKWKEDYGHNITNQLKRTGASLDWSREFFTLDTQRSTAVIEAFVRLYESGLIYRSKRLINWCCHLRTAISNIEIDTLELEKSTLLTVPSQRKKFEFGVIYRFAFPVEGGGEIEIETTRPETMFGDTAVAVHPKDPRYAAFHNKFVIHPLTNRRIPIICDEELVDMSFGTGALKVTPAHDVNDFNCGEKHQLEFINILNDDGTLNEAAGSYKGMDRFSAREAIVKQLSATGLFKGKKNHKMNLAICSRSGEVLEPLVKPQWYVKTREFSKKCSELVKEGNMDIHPEYYTADWHRWMEDNVQDWCVSRQLWWGHRIPAYRVVSSQLPADGEETWVVARTAEEAAAAAQKLFQLEPSSFQLIQDEDVLDTWFSSALLPISSFGWPNNDTQELQKYYPLSVMETGADIMFFWVARMTMLCSFFTKEAPFKQIYLHGLIRDAKGRKMSKRLGNVIDPVHVIEGISLNQLKANLLTGNITDPEEIKRSTATLEMDFPEGIPECGTDALRFTLVAYTQQARNINLEVQRVASNRRFCNKMWNATRFVLTQLANTSFAPDSLQRDSYECLSLVDQWILSKLSAAVQHCNHGLETFDFFEATSAIYNFFLYEFCDVYVEFSKSVFYKKYSNLSDAAYQMRTTATQHILYICLETAFRLLHPFMPFISEELWQRLPHKEGSTKESIMISAYPLPSHPSYQFHDEKIESAMQDVLNVIHTVRNIRKDNHVPGHKLLDIIIATDDAALSAHLNKHKEDILTFSKGSSLQFQSAQQQYNDSQMVTRIVDHRYKVVMHVHSELNFDAEIKKLQLKESRLQAPYLKLKEQMSSASYSQKVPLAIQSRDTERLRQLEKELNDTRQSIEQLVQRKEASAM